MIFESIKKLWKSKVQKTQIWDKDLNFNSIKATVLSNGKYYYLKCCFDDEENIKDQKE